MMALGVLAGGLLASCSMDNEPSIGKSGMLAKAPKMSAYSGNHYWGTTSATRGHDVNVNMWGGEGYWDCPSSPELTAEDIQAIKELLSKGTPTYNDVILPFENYFVEQVYKGDSQYTPTDINGNPVNGSSITGSDQMDLLAAYNETVNNQWWNPELDQWGAMDTNHYEHVNNFNKGDNTNNPSACTQGHQHNGITLMTDMKVPEDLDPNTQFGFHESFGTSHYYNNYIIVQYKGYWYVGFDYEMHKKEAQNANEAKDVERDWNFTDWIVRITPAYHYGETPSENPGQVTDPSPDPETPEIPGGGVIIPDYPIVPFPGLYGACIICGHEHDPETPCEECEEGIDCGEKITDEVEINLAVDKKNDDLLESHLSMHVRSATDVEVFIPVPAQYYCASDDMEIVIKHDQEFVHGGPYQTKFEIGDNTVTLNVAFEKDGIRIWTEGINEEVIEYCRENYGDGITFEVWNYFNDPETGLPYISMEELKEYLDQATVKFLDEVPDQYINAFGKLNGKYSDENPDGKDFHVVPDEECSDDFEDPVDGPHYNGSDNNEIYKKK